MAHFSVEELIHQEFIDPYKPAHQLGPDYILPTNTCRTWSPNGAIPIDIPSDLDPKWTPISVVSFFRQTVLAYPHNVALVSTKNERKVQWSFTQYWDDVRTAAKGFIKLGLEPFHGVGILGFNSPEWFMSHLAATFAGAFSAGIYTTSSPSSCFHVLNDCFANIIVVQDQTQLHKILQIRHNLPHLKAIVQYEGKVTHHHVISWDDLLRIGRSLPEHILETRIKGLSINQCSCLIYTSGTTGNSKGVMLSHDNILTIARFVCYKLASFKEGMEHYISYLPLNHVAAMIADIYMGLLMAATIYFTTPDVLKGKLVEKLLEVKPTILIAVPRVLEKMQDRLKEVEESLWFVRKWVLKWARRSALDYHTRQKFQSRSKPFLYSVCKKLVLNKVKRALGLEKTVHFLCGGAPLSVEVQQYFLSLDMILLEGYGLSESSCVHIGNTQRDNKIGSVGNTNLFKDLQVKIHNPDQDGNGEVLLRGRNIFIGYLQMEEQTKESLDNDRWLHTGDMGMIDPNGYLYITGRIKELIITSGGENIPPLFIESTIKKLLPVVSNCMVIGDGRKYLTMLLTLKTEFDMETALPSDHLTQLATSWCVSAGSQAKSVNDILDYEDGKVMNGIQTAVDVYNNKEAISNAQRIQKWRILPQDFSLPTGELGPTGKMKRPYILLKYSRFIDSMY